MPDRVQVVCPACAAVNRLPSDRPAEKAVCGSCREKLFQGHPAEADTAMFDKQVARSSVPIVVDVWAPWCGPCKMMAPAFEQVAREMEPKVRFLKLNSDKEQQAAAKLGIRGIPTMILYSGGREIARQSGAMSASQITGWIRQHLG
ncbi:thioredoxin TrxC [Oricola cellulosilytica]|uniref:Thioredoxin n=1 Tax=Oricola cellulosilytica TaxID=1429082 RepID=A0A4R0P9Z5_9HYPH|nr:thioredoxin TrxC [Oricola cellulosilytica]TCD14080.1 thioredoxin TrxC [Oricola cellulosilytica]